MPQPSDDPRDPLNWPTWRKEACFWTFVFAASLANAISPLASVAYVQLAKEFHVSVDEVASCFSANFIGDAIFVLLQSPLAIKYGHRIVYLLATFLMFISCVWSALSTDLVSISASRVFQGFGGAPLQSLVAITIGQLFFVHERGTRSCIWGLFQVAGTVLGPLVNGYVIQNLSLRLGFWFVSIACGVCFIGVVLFVPEWHKIYLGFFWQISQTWFALLSYLMPAVFLGLVSLCSSTIFTVTYRFNTAQIGLTHLGGLIGSVVGVAVTGPLGDWCIVWISQRNRGVYEPEFRLILMISLLVGALGYVGWAVGNEHHMPWVGAVACIAMLYFGTLVSGAALFPYLIDVHGSNSLHIISLMDFAKNVLIYGSAFFANGIVLSAGVKLSLLVYGACQAVCWLTCVPMYVYGKRARSFIARHPRLFRGDSSHSGVVSETDLKS
ncbi:MFS general substrate transporter [Ganoderma sinense ZZ0214-1]|uniref:MFS general substrate transporter n=1 Tax=Ganoderma sinense ZZ0214-1 TaxID=1077348 RepID=A0A2G8SBJ3_9APHY|nr:MFS general substrate transporter [Ganoderma sinense ZZ0214-1]